ncbi:hypothetical protein B0H13DRAFT_1879845 [Mycena leptocephala]|nr:hypothetical protein B0H13DRAFT_1879845 [Mycena leptocephala]
MPHPVLLHSHMSPFPSPSSTWPTTPPSSTKGTLAPRGSPPDASVEDRTACHVGPESRNEAVAHKVNEENAVSGSLPRPVNPRVQIKLPNADSIWEAIFDGTSMVYGRVALRRRAGANTNFGCITLEA